MFTVEILEEDQVFDHDAHAVSDLMTELSGTKFNISHDDLRGMAKDTTVVVARSLEDEGAIVGIGCLISMNLPQGYRHLIESLVVLPQYRGHQLGKKIITMLIEEARKCGKGNINLTCNSTRESALRLYKGVGFKKADTTVYRLKL